MKMTIKKNPQKNSQTSNQMNSMMSSQKMNPQKKTVTASKKSETVGRPLATQKSEAIKAETGYEKAMNHIKCAIDALGTKVQLKGNAERGSMVIEYYTKEDLNRIYSVIIEKK